jgi:hypothetical protein
VYKILPYACSNKQKLIDLKPKFKDAMKKNMGTADKAIRILIAVVIAVLFFTNVISGTLGIVLLLLAAVFLLTSFISFCPLYLPFGIRTNKTQE